MKISKTSPSPRSPEFLVFLHKAHSLTSTLCISYFAKYLKCSLTHCIEVVFLSVCLLLQSSPPSVLPWAQLFPFAPSSHTVVPVSWPPLLPDTDLALQTDSLCAGALASLRPFWSSPAPSFLVLAGCLLPFLTASPVPWSHQHLSPPPIPSHPQGQGSYRLCLPSQPRSRMGLSHLDVVQKSNNRNKQKK